MTYYPYDGPLGQESNTQNLCSICYRQDNPELLAEGSVERNRRMKAHAKGDHQYCRVGECHVADEIHAQHHRWRAARSAGRDCPSDFPELPDWFDEICGRQFEMCDHT